MLIYVSDASLSGSAQYMHQLVSQLLTQLFVSHQFLSLAAFYMSLLEADDKVIIYIIYNYGSVVGIRCFVELFVSQQFVWWYLFYVSVFFA